MWITRGSAEWREETTQRLSLLLEVFAWNILWHELRNVLNSGWGGVQRPRRAFLTTLWHFINSTISWFICENICRSTDNESNCQVPFSTTPQSFSQRFVGLQVKICVKWTEVKLSSRYVFVVSVRQIITRTWRTEQSTLSYQCSDNTHSIIHSWSVWAWSHTVPVWWRVNTPRGISAVSSTVVTVCIMFVFPPARFLSSLFPTCFLTGSDWSSGWRERARQES